MFEHSIEDGKELAHAGSEGHLLGLTCDAEALIESSDDGVRASGHQGGHVEDSPYTSPTSPNGALASEGTTVSVEGSYPYQGSDLPTVQGNPAPATLPGG